MLFLLALEQLEEGERELIGRLYCDYSKKVKEMSVKIMRSESQADDIVNDTFLKVIRYKEKFFDVSEVERIRLIIICVRSICFNLLDRNKKIRFEPLEAYFKEENKKYVSGEFSSDVDLLAKLVKDETGNYLQSVIERLESPARDMIILKFYHEMKNNEIAEFFKMKPATVNTIIHRSIKLLRKELEGYIYGTDK